MKPTYLAAFSSLGVIAIGAVWWLAIPAPDKSASETAIDTERGRVLYAENCASCHGADLEGQPNWRETGPDGRLPAPPHDRSGHTWHHSDQILFSYTKLGGKELMRKQGSEFDSGMPGFGDKLTDQEINDVLGFIKSTWPERERKAQAARTEAEQEG
ncbi:cytochrome C [Thioclava sp. JM3]|uniref:c-type cytochrome n=1 Tax=Thioclava sp. JM3 TaxID=1973004 RepID=UPI000B53B798|nr:cytochrome c [Thioclava sp. JM3]OWY11605.1 cytochrome C [Thioclava sp. JM3]